MAKFLRKYRVVEILTPCLVFGTMTPGIAGLSKSLGQPQVLVVFLVVLYSTIPINFLLVFRQEILRKLRR
jgi:hypothetical protein